MNAPEHWVWLLAMARNPHIKPLTLHAWLKQFSQAPTELLEASESLLTLCRCAVDAPSLQLARQDLESALDSGLTCVDYWNPEYPYRLREISSAPPLLFAQGPAVNWNAPKVGAVVGSRACSPQGLAFTRELVRGLAAQGIAWISGLALGIDGAMHQSALDSGQATWGVLAGDVRRVYPPGNRKLAHEMTQRPGCALLSENLGRQAFDPLAFKRRNRLIAGMADFVVLVESKDPSGSLITAQYAEAFDRRLFAVPQHPSHALSKGPNGLIQQQRALLCQQGSDIVQEMNWS
ncbi:MAG: DNA-protecting protein DprA [Bacteroidetes bacterium]|nr:DNA-protecting protein DprA [Bacteroidota bacterium]MDA0944214.1 DNA-protecting protein DprA [Bacteroidota bacterium]MDA1112306.1 DNA-protecting protein DprA [Bacteroidota bacterium]